MDGQPLRGIFKLNRKMKYTVYNLDKNRKSRAKTDSDREAIEELKALGYI